MKKCYLITAYDQPQLLARLIRALQAQDVHFFVHIDRKFPVAPFRAAIGSPANVRIYNSRKITWMGFSQVASTLDLMREAAKERCDYYTLLSGSDYPIKSNQYILDFFSRARCELLSFFRLEDRPSWLHKIHHYYPTDWVPIWNYQATGFPRYFWGYFYKLAPRFPRRRFPAGLVPYGGCGWWSMSHDCLAYILEFVDRNPSFVRFYRYTHCPIEMFFHTIVLNSPLASRVCNYDAYQSWSARTPWEAKKQETHMLPEEDFNYRHVDWSPTRTTGLGRPATLNDADIGALRNSKALFARKFDENGSLHLLDLVDQMRAQPRY